MADKTVTIEGGLKLSRKLADIAHRLGNGATLSVGFLSNADYPSKTAEDIKKKIKPRGKNGAARQAKAAASNLLVAQNAFWQEYGTSRAPARPFFRNMIAEKSPDWGRKLGVAARNNNYDAKGALTALGIDISDDLRESILTLTDPPLSPKTIAIKGFDKPLVDTGVMSRSVDFEVKTK